MPRSYKKWASVNLRLKLLYPSSYKRSNIECDPVKLRYAMLNQMWPKRINYSYNFKAKENITVVYKHQVTEHKSIINSSLKHTDHFWTNQMNLHYQMTNTHIQPGWIH